MKKLILLIAFLCAASGSALAQSAPPFRLEEIDGAPSVLSPTRIKVTNGTLSCTGKTCTITIAGGAGTVTSVGWTGGIVSVATATTTPAFTIAGTSGGIPYFSGATTWASSAALAANALVIGGGAGVAPATTTTGTGVLTFLGTPSSANLATALTDETGTGLAVFGTAPTFASTMTIGTAGGTTGAINLKGTTSGTVTLTTAAAAGTYTLTLPVDDGTASQFLQTDGAGALTWASASSGITIGTTTITSGAAGRLLYETSGNVVGEVAGSSADANGALALATTARSSGVTPYLTVTAPADTALTASTEAIGVSFVGATREHATGALTTQREYVFAAPTYSFVGASTITTAATVSIAKPIAGTNATLTNSWNVLLNASGTNTIATSGDEFTLKQTGDTLGETRMSLRNRTGFNGLYLENPVIGLVDLAFKATGANSAGIRLADPLGTIVQNGELQFGAIGTPSFIVSQNAGVVVNGAGNLFGVNITASLGAQAHIVSGSTSRLATQTESASAATVALSNLIHTSDQTAAVRAHTQFYTRSSGTAATGLGGRLLFGLESSTTNDQDAAAIDWLWTDATHASRASALTFSVVTGAGALTEVGRFTQSTTNGQLTLGLASTTTGKLGLAVSGDADVTTIQAGDAPASAVAYKWPADDPAAAELLKVTSFSGGVATLEWAAGGGGAAWSALTDPAGNLALTMAANTSTFTYNATTSTANLFVLTNGSNDTGTGYVLQVLTPGASNAKKAFGVTSRGALAFEITATGAPSSPGAGVNSERYGLDSAAGGSAGQAFGKQSSAGGADAVALGSSAGAAGDNSVAVGNNASANYARQIAIGRSADAGIFATDAIAIGYAATSGSATTKGIAIGSGANVLYTSAIALGYAATATADNQFVLGSETGPITALYLGEGVTSTTPASVAINATGESGTDQSVASVALNLASAKGTGTGDPGTIGLQFARAGSTGASLNAISDEWRASYSTTDTVTLAANIKTSTTTLTAATTISSVWTDATHATRTSAITFNTVNSAAALAERFRINGTGVTIGAGATITNVLSATASLDFGATAAGACDLLTITVTGAADGDVVSIGVPTALAASDNYQSFNGYVSAADTVTVKRCNLLNLTTALSNPAAATVRASVIQH